MAQILLSLGILYSVCGFAVSAVLHVLSLLGLQPQEDTLLFGMMFGIFPLLVPVTHITMKMINAERVFARDGLAPAGLDWRATFGKGASLETILSGCPNWMKRVLRALQIYVFLAFAVMFLMPFVAGTQQFVPRAIWWFFSAGAMAGYLYGLAVLITVRRKGIENLTPRCTNGHRVVSGDRFCATCGTPISEQPLRVTST